jgi:hypothetical protein
VIGAEKVLDNWNVDNKKGRAISAPAFSLPKFYNEPTPLLIIISPSFFSCENAVARTISLTLKSWAFSSRSNLCPF